MKNPPNCIWLVSPPGSMAAPCFQEVALALEAGFRELGLDVPLVTDSGAVRGRALVLNAHAADLRNAPADAFILFNLEQVTDQSGFFDEIYVQMLRRFEVWDYSPRNISLLAERGVTAKLCSIGYAPCLTRISLAPIKDLDVVFVGSHSGRRHDVLQQIHEAGRQVVAMTNCFGESRDALYARAKIVLNLHILEAQIFEVVRCSYLLANKICILSETGKDKALEEPFRDAIAFSDYADLVDTCLRLLDDDARRTALAERGFEIFSEMTQARSLREVMA